jgi:diaminopimelate decarboxylase
MASKTLENLADEDAAIPPLDLAAALVRRNFATLDNELLIGGVPISRIVAQFGSPLYIYDLGVLRRQWQRLRETLPSRFDICYSVKANPNQAVLRTFVALGCGLEIASSGELVQALAAGCPAEQILFAGPGKTEAELDCALAAGVGEIHVESKTEALRIARLAAARHIRAPIALRVNPATAAAGGSMRMGGKPVPFGIDEDQLDDLVPELLRHPELEIVGLHLFMGTQILDYRILVQQYAAGIEIAKRLQALLGRPLRTIDFGGGWGVPYFAQDQQLDLQSLQTELARWVQDLDRHAPSITARFLVEPGRFLAAEAGVYCTQVTDLKTSRGKQFAVVDGGMHHHLAASGNLGQTIKRNYPVAVLNKLFAPKGPAVDVVGPLCTPLDVLARNVELPPLAVGDWIGVFQSGAYGRSASPLGFLSRPAPPEVVVDEGTARLARARSTDQDFLADQIF